MALRPLHLLGSPILREKSGDVTVDAEIEKLVADLYETMYAAQGIGLAANQVGLAKRVAVVDAQDLRITLINPVILEREGTDRAEEGCLSIPEIYGDVDRAQRVVIETATLDGEREKIELSELPARAVQHEIDHLDGILFLDHLSPLRRRMLLKKWKKFRKGEEGFIQHVQPIDRAAR